MLTNIGIWHRNDLRLRDNKALALGMKDGNVHPFFIFDPRFYKSSKVSDKRIKFLHESLEELDEKYQSKGSRMTYYHGSVQDTIRDILGTVDKLYVKSDVSSGYARERDMKLSRLDDVEFIHDDGVKRDQPTRENWRVQAEEYFKSETFNEPSSINKPILNSKTSIEDIEETYNTSSETGKRHRGGCKTGYNQLDSFIEDIDEYVGSISSPWKAEKNTSQLSPYIKFGCVSIRDAYQSAKKDGDDGRAVEMFTSRLFWNQHFTQKLYDNPDIMRESINPVFRGINYGTHDDKMSERWKNGTTGFPLIDASMRSLKQTGWMNFRMRAMCSSFYTYILRCWWKKGADWFYKHLVDADPAINYYQWQMQSGLVGVHPLRIYNPMKQVRENDPEGKFIKKYVPELRDFPAKYLDNPKKAPIKVQEECGVDIGEDYPYPIVNYEQRRDEARDKWSDLDDRAKEALELPSVLKKASLSSDRKEELDSNEQDADGQTRLSDFG